MHAYSIGVASFFGLKFKVHCCILLAMLTWHRTANKPIWFHLKHFLSNGFFFSWCKHYHEREQWQIVTISAIETTRAMDLAWSCMHINALFTFYHCEGTFIIVSFLSPYVILIQRWNDPMFNILLLIYICLVTAAVEVRCVINNSWIKNTPIWA